MPSSSRDPVPTQNPVVTEPTSGMRSVTMVIPQSDCAVSTLKWLPPPAGIPPGPSVVPPGRAAGASRLGRSQVAKRGLGLLLPAVLKGDHVVGVGEHRRASHVGT